MRNKLPSWLVAAIAMALTGLLIYNVYSDIKVEGYEGYGTTAILAAIIAGVLGLHDWKKDDEDKPRGGGHAR